MCLSMQCIHKMTMVSPLFLRASVSSDDRYCSDSPINRGEDLGSDSTDVSFTVLSVTSQQTLTAPFTTVTSRASGGAARYVVGMLSLVMLSS